MSAEGRELPSGRSPAVRQLRPVVKLHIHSAPELLRELACLPPAGRPTPPNLAVASFAIGVCAREWVTSLVDPGTSAIHV